MPKKRMSLNEFVQFLTGTIHNRSCIAADRKNRYGYGILDYRNVYIAYLFINYFTAGAALTMYGDETNLLIFEKSIDLLTEGYKEGLPKDMVDNWQVVLKDFYVNQMVLFKTDRDQAIRRLSEYALNVLGYINTPSEIHTIINSYFDFFNDAFAKYKYIPLLRAGA